MLEEKLNIIMEKKREMLTEYFHESEELRATLCRYLQLDYPKATDANILERINHLLRNYENMEWTRWPINTQP